MPGPPTGPVTVVGWVRADATGDSTAVDDRSTRAISSERSARPSTARSTAASSTWPRRTPRPAEPLARTDTPDLSNGPHFFYGLQWWFFAALAVFGFGYLAYDERRKLLRGPPGDHDPPRRTRLGRDRGVHAHVRRSERAPSYSSTPR